MSASLFLLPPPTDLGAFLASAAGLEPTFAPLAPDGNTPPPPESPASAQPREAQEGRESEPA